MLARQSPHLSYNPILEATRAHFSCFVIISEVSSSNTEVGRSLGASHPRTEALKAGEEGPAAGLAPACRTLSRRFTELLPLQTRFLIRGSGFSVAVFCLDSPRVLVTHQGERGEGTAEGLETSGPAWPGT